MKFSKILTFIIKQDKIFKQGQYLIFGIYYYANKIVFSNKSQTNSIPGQISDDVYPLM
jgi:hypothetical protein